MCDNEEAAKCPYCGHEFPMPDHWEDGVCSKCKAKYTWEDVPELTWPSIPNEKLELALKLEHFVEDPSIDNELRCLLKRAVEIVREYQ